MMMKPALALLLGLVLLSTPLGGCASRQTPAPTSTPPADQQDPDPQSGELPDTADSDDPTANEPPPVSAPPGLSASDRVQSAVEGMVVGAASASRGTGPRCSRRPARC